MARKDKIRVEVVIPKSFRDFIRKVACLIAARDDSTTMESDDLLQCDTAYGGLYDAERRFFGFRLFPSAGDGVYWDFWLHESEILAIADGQVTNVSLWRCANSKCQSRHASEDSYCPNCDNVLDFLDVEADLRRFHPDSPSDAIECMASIQRIAFALLDYQAATGHFPPPYTSDGEGGPLHSWRTLILPQLDEESLFRQVAMDEPWDSPRNRELWHAMPHVYRCAKQPDEISTTSFLAVTGPDTMWPIGDMRVSADVEAGTSNVILLMEQRDGRAIWMSPLDMRFADLFSSAKGKPSSAGHVDDEFIAAFVDGHVESLSTRLDLERLRQLLTIR